MRRTRSRYQGSVWRATTALKRQKMGEAGLIHWPYRVDESWRTSCFDALNEADSYDRPQKIKCKLLISSVVHSRSSFRKAYFGSRPYSYCKVSKSSERYKAANLDDRPKFFLLSSLSICSIDLTDDGKLGYGFTSADELEEIDIGPGDKSRPTFVSKKLCSCLRELMIALLKEYVDCFA
jgi:hypothetical protein